MNALLTDFHFLRPAWLLGVLLLPWLLWRWRQRAERADPWRAACDPHLLAHLTQAGQGAAARWPRVLFVAGFVLALLALAGPAFRQQPQALARAESALIVALDLSDRMRATDVKPDRIARARYKIADLLRARREGQTALVGYAGDAFTVAPLTDDAQSLGDLLAAMTPDTMPVGGQRADRAIELAQRLLRDGGFVRGDLLLVTDRADAAAQAAAARAREAGLTVSVLGVGTAAGAPVGLPQGGFARDENGEVLLPRLDESSLRALADAGGGSYAALAVGPRDLAALGVGGAALDDARLRQDERQRVAYRDDGPWLLLLLLPLAALAFRRGWLGCVLVLLLPAPRAEAFEWDGLWRRPDQRAWQALHAGDAARARELARDVHLRGSAAYRAEDYAGAAQDFARAADADAHYNRGNALARAQQFEQALAAYDEALALAPGMEDAQANRQAVQDWLKQQEEGESESSEGEDGAPQEGQQQSPQDSQGQEQQQSGENSQGQPQSSEGEAGESDDASGEAADDEAQRAQEEFEKEMQKALEEGTEPGEAAAPAGDPREAEKQQAVEQWLRRVPDDPGGLLRRKFALEYQRRQREGGGE